MYKQLYAAVANALFAEHEKAYVLTSPDKSSSQLRVIDLRDHDVKSEDDLPELWYPNVPAWYVGSPRLLTPEEAKNSRGGKSSWRRQKSYPQETNRWMVLETDTLLVPQKAGNLPPEEIERLQMLQKAAVLHAADMSGLPYTLAIDSGHKSIHFVFRFVDSDETIREFREASRLNKIADLLGIVMGQLDVNVCRYFGRGWWARFPYGWRRETQHLQNVLRIGSKTTTAALTQWARKQLTDEAFHLIMHNRRKPSDRSRPLALDIDSWRYSVLSDGSDGRGLPWRNAAYDVAKTGSKAPRMIASPIERPPFGKYDASYLWHLSSFVYNVSTNGWFYSSNIRDYTPQSSGQGDPKEGVVERLRWPSDAGTEFYQESFEERIAREREPYDLDTKRFLQERRRAWSPQFSQFVEKLIENARDMEADIPDAQAEIVCAAEKSGKTVDEYVAKRRKPLSPLETAAASAMAALVKQEEKSEKFKAVRIAMRISGDDGQPPIIPKNRLRYDVFSKNKTHPWYRFDGKIWRKQSAEAITKTVIDIIGVDASVAQLNEVLSVMKTLYDDPDVVWSSEEGYSCTAFPNGTLIFWEHQKRWEFHENQWWPEHNLRSMFATPFKATGQVPREIEDVMFRGIKDPEDRECFLQFVAMLALPGQPFQKWMMIEGLGGDGKSAVVDILRAMVGHENYAPIHLHQLGQRFHLSSAENAFLAADSDAAALTPSSNYGASEAYITNTLKDWTGGDEVHLERKSVDPHKSRMNAKFIALVNERPHITDPSYGFWRRMLYFKWEAPTLQEHEKIYGIGRALGARKDLLQELFGAAWAALVNGLATGSIDQPAAMRKRLLEYREDTDSVAAFCRHMQKIDGRTAEYWKQLIFNHEAQQDLGIDVRFVRDKIANAEAGREEYYTLAAVFAAYKDFCENENLPAIRSSSKFLRRMMAAGYKTTRPSWRHTNYVVHGSTGAKRAGTVFYGCWCSYERWTQVSITMRTGIQVDQK